MKKIILSLSVMMTVAATAVFANEDPGVGEDVLTSFEKEFAGAQSVEWKTEADYFKATFILGDHRTIAYFNQDGELEGSIRSIFYTQLPLAVLTAVNKKYAGAEVLDVNEVNNNSGTFYRITLESGEKKYRMRVDAAGNITSTEKLKK